MDHESEVANERRHRRTHLFTVRLWIEHVAEHQVEVRGQVQHVLGDGMRHFRKWVELTTFFEDMLQELEGTDSIEKKNEDD